MGGRWMLFIFLWVFETKLIMPIQCQINLSRGNESLLAAIPCALLIQRYKITSMSQYFQIYHVENYSTFCSQTVTHLRKITGVDHLLMIK